MFEILLNRGVRQVNWKDPSDFKKLGLIKKIANKIDRRVYEKSEGLIDE
jgi:hypothetical protein